MSSLSILIPYYGYETNKYSNTHEFQRGKVTTTTTRVHTQITMSGQRGREAEPRDQKYGNAVKQEEGGILANAVPYFNPKYGRRSEAYFDFFFRKYPIFPFLIFVSMQYNGIFLLINNDAFLVAHWQKIIKFLLLKNNLNKFWTIFLKYWFLRKKKHRFFLQIEVGDACYRPSAGESRPDRHCHAAQHASWSEESHSA